MNIFLWIFSSKKGISTENRASAIVDRISHNFDRSNFVIGVFLDLAKAFDTIDRNIIFGKLDIYGIKNLWNSFLKSYFTGDNSIKISNSMIQHQVEKGIAQGSIIGPLMFLIYVDDMV